MHPSYVGNVFESAVGSIHSYHSNAYYLGDSPLISKRLKRSHSSRNFRPSTLSPEIAPASNGYSTRIASALVREVFLVERTCRMIRMMDFNLRCLPCSNSLSSQSIDTS